jgi:hypothetical protein
MVKNGRNLAEVLGRQAIRKWGAGGVCERGGSASVYHLWTIADFTLSTKYFLPIFTPSRPSSKHAIFRAFLGPDSGPV